MSKKKRIPVTNAVCGKMAYLVQIRSQTVNVSFFATLA